MVDRRQQLEGPGAVVVQRQREDLGAARAARKGRERRARRAGRDRRVVHLHAVRLDIERAQHGGRVRHKLERRRVRPVGAEVHQGVERADCTGKGRRRGRLVAARQPAFIRGAAETRGAAGDHRHVVGVAHRECAADGVAVEVLGREVEREVEVVLAGDLLVERLVENEVVAAVRGRRGEHDREHHIRRIDRGRRRIARKADERVGIEQGVSDGLAVRRQVGDGIAVAVRDRDVVCSRGLVREVDRTKDSRGGAARDREVIEHDLSAVAGDRLELKRREKNALERRAGRAEQGRSFNADIADDPDRNGDRDGIAVDVLAGRNDVVGLSRTDEKAEIHACKRKRRAVGRGHGYDRAFGLRSAAGHKGSAVVPGDVDVAGRDRARRLAQAVEIDGLRCSWNSRRAGRGRAVSAEVDAERAAEGGGGTGVVAGAVGIGRRREAAFVDAAGGRAGEHRHVVDDRDLEVARQRDAVAVEVDRLDQAGQVEGGRILALGRLVDRIDQRERVAAVAVEDEREHPGAARRGARIGGQRLGRPAGRDGEVVDLDPVRLDAEIVAAGRDGELEAVLARPAEGGTVGAEAHEARERAAHGRGDAGDAVVVAIAVEVTRAGGREGQRPFVDAAGRAGGAGEHRHVVDDRDLEVARQRDAVAVEVDRLDQAGQVEGGRILALGRLVDRIDQRERVAAVAVEDEREHPGAARRGARIGGQRLGRPAGRDGEVVDLDPVRLDAEIVAAGRDGELEAVLARPAEGGTVGAEAHEARERAAHGRGDAGDAVVVAIAVEVTRAGGREGQRPFVDAAGRAGGAGEHRRVVDHRDLEVARGKRDAAAVEVDRLDQGREIERCRCRALVRPVIERVDQRERIGAIAVELESEHLRPGRRGARIGGQRLRRAAARDGIEVDLDAVRLDPEVVRAARRHELEAVLSRAVEGRAIGPEAHQARDRAAVLGREAGLALLVAAAVEIAQRAGRKRAFLHAA